MPTYIGNSNSGKIERFITDGLVLYLDAGVSQSYFGTGTTWFDLSENNSDATLSNNPPYVNNKYFDFTNSNAYADVVNSSNLEFQPTQEFSVFCWVYDLPTDSGTGAVCSNMLNGGVIPGWDFWKNSSTVLGMHLISSWPDSAIKVGIDFDYAGNSGKWVYIGYTYDGSSPTTSSASLNSLDFYINGVLSETGKAYLGGNFFNSASETISYDASQKFRIASRWLSGVTASPLSFNMSIVTIYNRKLTELEINTNFQKTRQRFGI